MIAENPMTDDRLFIIHNRKPRFIAEVKEPEIEVVQWIDDPDRPERLAKLMSRMGDWYVAYCEWEDDDTPNLN